MNQPEPQSTARSISAKFVVAGGFGVGKTTFVGAVSEIKPLRTEETMTEAAASVDDASKVSTKQSTTVAMDFGRVSVPGDLVLYLFGTPGQHRFAFMWDKICLGALGAIVLVDLRRIEDAFAVVDYFESRKIPFVCAVNTFADGPNATEADVRGVLALRDSVPIVWLDARDKEQVKSAIVSLIDLLLGNNGAQVPTVVAESAVLASSVIETSPVVETTSEPIGAGAAPVAKRSRMRRADLGRQ